MERTAHIISHTHWDREWFLPARYVYEWLPPFFDALFAILQEDSAYRFVLDGQTVMIEDCLRHYDQQQRAEFRARLKRYVGEGRLIIGPYYLQPDWHIPSDEALIRNIEIGMAAAASFGARPHFGWLLDNFGQIAQAPQLHRGFGLDRLFLWRGVDIEPAALRCEAMWRGADGSEVLTFLMLDSYRNAMRLLDEPERLRERLDEIYARLAPLSVSGQLLLMNGYDQEMEPENPLPALATLQTGDPKVAQSTPEEYAAAVEAWLNKTGARLPTLHGAQRLGRYSSVFPGVLSARIYLKQYQRQCETLLVRYLEPLLLISGLGHIEAIREQLNRLWRQTLRNLPHDSICGVSVDPAHIDAERRCQMVERQALRLLTRCAAALVPPAEGGRGQSPKVEYALFQPGPRPFGEVIAVAEPRSAAVAGGRNSRNNRGAMPAAPIPVAYIGERMVASQTAANGDRYLYLPPSQSVGLQAIHFRHPSAPSSESAKPSQPIQPSQPVSVSDGRMRNAFVEVGFAADGAIELRCLKSGRSYSGLHRFVDGGDAGDTYSYSPPLNDRLVASDEASLLSISFVEQGPLLARARIEMELRVPGRLSAHRCHRSERLSTLLIVSEVVLCADSPLVRFYTTVQNRACDHRLRLHFPTDCSTDQAWVSGPFAATAERFESRHCSDAELPQEVRRILLGAREPTPDGFVPCSGYVDVADSDGGLTLINPELPEIELISERRTIALTLLRSVGWLARSDLSTRIGDAGPHIAVPDAQCWRKMSYVYALYPHRGSTSSSSLAAVAASELAAPSLWWRLPSGHSMTADHRPVGRLVTLDAGNPGVVLTSARASEAGAELRLCNFDPIDRVARIALAPEMRNPRLTRLDGSALDGGTSDGAGQITVNRDGTLDITFVPQAIVTLMVDLAADGSGQRQSAPATTPRTTAEHGILMPRIAGLSAHGFSLPADETLLGSAATRQWLRAERRRVAALRHRLKAAQRHSGPPGEVGQMRARSTRSTLQRELYEARISVLLLVNTLRRAGSGRKRHAADPRWLARRLRILGLQLNRARIAKRSDDFRVALAEAKEAATK